MTWAGREPHVLGGRGQVQRGGLLAEPLDHVLEHPGGGLVRDHLVGRGEQVALGLALGEGGQAERRRVLERLGVGAGREAGLGPQVGDDLAQPPAFRDGHLDLDHVVRVDQQRVGQGGLHVLVHPVEAGQQPGSAGAVLGRQHERALARHHAQLHQLRRQARRRVARGDLDRDRAGPFPGEISRMVLAHVQVVAIDAADGQRDHDNQQRGQRRDPAEPAPAAARHPGAGARRHGAGGG